MPLRPFMFPEDLRYLNYLEYVYKFNVFFNKL